MWSLSQDRWCLWRPLLEIQGFSRCCFIEPLRLQRSWCTWMATFNWIDAGRKYFKIALEETVRRSNGSSWSLWTRVWVLVQMARSLCGPRRNILNDVHHTKKAYKTCLMALSGDGGVQQMHHYYADGFPTIPSYYPYLFEGCWHIRDLKRVESSLMGCAWMAEYLRWDQPRDQLSFNYAMWKLSKCINMREEDFLRVGVELANVVERTRNPHHGKKRERFSTDKCAQIKNYSKQCDRDPQCKPCKLLPVSAEETSLQLGPASWPAQL